MFSFDFIDWKTFNKIRHQYVIKMLKVLKINTMLLRFQIYLNIKISATDCEQGNRCVRYKYY